MCFLANYPEAGILPAFLLCNQKPYKPIQTNTNQYKPIQTTHTNPYKLIVLQCTPLYVCDSQRE